MGILRLNSGREIACDGVTTGWQYNNFLHIHTDALGYIEAAQLFTNEEETASLVYSEKETVYTFSGYTKLLGIEGDPLIHKENELLIRLGKPEGVT